MEKQGAKIQALLPGLAKLQPRPGDTVFFARRKTTPEEFEAQLRGILNLETHAAESLLK